MTRYEFLNDLKAALTGNVSGEVINEHMQYYDEYIAAQLRQGKTEEMVMSELGDPRLIARTIVDTSGAGSSQSTYADESWEEEGGRTHKESGAKGKKPGMNPATAAKIRLYVTIALVLILIVLIVGFLFTAIGAIIYIFWPVLIVLIVFHLMTRNNRYR